MKGGGIGLNLLIVVSWFKMQRTLTLYVTRNVLLGVLLVLCVLLGVSLLFEFLDGLEKVSKYNAAYTDIFYLVIFSVPAIVYETFPSAVLIGGLLALGGMASKSELIAMRAAGVSKVQISMMVAFTGIFLMLFIVAVGELLLPKSETQKEMLESKIKGWPSTTVINNVWLKEGRQFIKIGQAPSDKHLLDVEIYEFIDQKVSSIIQAKEAHWVEQNWQLQNVIVTVFNDEQVMVSEKEALSYNWQFDLSLFTVIDRPETLTLMDLHTYANYMEANDLDGSRYRLSFWLKLMSPVTVMVMLMLALPFAFGSLRTMASGNLIVIGLVVGLGYYIFSGIASHLGYLYGLPPFINAFAPSVIFILLALFLMLRQKF